jgi:hypothetical protein
VTGAWTAAANRRDDPSLGYDRSVICERGLEVMLHLEVEAWYLALCESDPETADLIEDAIDQLADQGPALGRPLADRVKGSC